MINVEKIKSLTATIEVEAGKFNAGNKAAGTRLRKALQDLKVEAQGLRNGVSEIKNAEVKA